MDCVYNLSSLWYHIRAGSVWQWVDSPDAFRTYAIFFGFLLLGEVPLLRVRRPGRWQEHCNNEPVLYSGGRGPTLCHDSGHACRRRLSGSRTCRTLSGWPP